MAQLAERARRCPDWPAIAPPRRPRSLWEFDHLITAPQCGFAGAEDYYRQTSPAPRLTRIDVPTLIVAAADDPLVPVAPFARHERSSAVRLLVTRSGGHLGFIARPSRDPDHRWLDWRLLDWLLAT
jgi:predicted alpha/beta-fold hydrolase